MSEASASEVKARLRELDADEESICEERRSIYQRSLAAADDNDKICDDRTAEMLAEKSLFKRISYPVTVNGIHFENTPMLGPSMMHPSAKWVAVRPCGDEYAGRTYLGILLGDIALSLMVQLSKDGILGVSRSMHNPAIYVPDLHEVVFGCGSWWSPIKTQDEIRQITDQDIRNFWYMCAMKDLVSDPNVPKGVE